MNLSTYGHRSKRDTHFFNTWSVTAGRGGAGAHVDDWLSVTNNYALSTALFQRCCNKAVLLYRLHGCYTMCIQHHYHQTHPCMVTCCTMQQAVMMYALHMHCALLLGDNMQAPGLLMQSFVACIGAGQCPVSTATPTLPTKHRD